MIQMHPITMLEGHCFPVKYGRESNKRQAVTPASAQVHIPTWNWHGIMDTPAGSKIVTLDTNGMYLAAIGTAEVAMFELAPTGPLHTLPDRRHVAPGYYLINVPNWAFSGTIVSPLGDKVGDRRTVWVAGPTLALLIELYECGAIAEVTVRDSYTGNARTDLRPWNVALKQHRNAHLALIAGAHTAPAEKEAEDRYDQFKQGYGQALSMMISGKCEIHRPDWSHTVYAQAHAAQWRKAWNYTETGHPLLSMGAVDAITVFADDLAKVMSRTKPPFRVDDTGLQLGAFKHKGDPVTVTARPRPALRIERGNRPAILTADTEDIL